MACMLQGRLFQSVGRSASKPAILQLVQLSVTDNAVSGMEMRSRMRQSQNRDVYKNMVTVLRCLLCFEMEGNCLVQNRFNNPPPKHLQPNSDGCDKFS